MPPKGASPTPKYVLHYFPMRARGELLRLIFAYTDTPYKDVRVTQEQWKDLKDKAPGGSMPFIEYNGKKYGQSGPLCRFVCADIGKGNLLGKTPLDRLVIEAVCEDVVDLRSGQIGFAFEADAAKKAEKEKKFCEETVPTFLKRLEDRLTANKTGFVHGPQCSLADLSVYDILFTLALGPGKEKVLAKSPKVKALMDKVAAIPAIAKWVKARPDTPF